MLKDICGSMSTTGILTQDSCTAIGVLINMLQERQRVTRKRFAKEFKVFSSSANLMEFKWLFVGIHTKVNTRNQTIKAANDTEYDA